MTEWVKAKVTIFDEIENGISVKFEEWHSDYMDEDFVGVTVFVMGREVFHSGMTHYEPTQENAESLAKIAIDVIDAIEAVEERKEGE